MGNRQDTKNEIMTVLVERVRSTGDTFSVFTGTQEGALSFAPVTVKMFTGPCRPTQRWILAGSWQEDPKWGRQFVAQFGSLAVPRTVHELSTFLTSDLIAGWTHATVYTLWTTFNGDAFDVVARQPHRLAEAGITDYQLESLQAMWARGAGLAPVYSALADWGIGAALADRLVRLYGYTTADVIRENPYAPIETTSYYTWRVAESIRERLDVADDDPRRVTAGVCETLRTGATEQGHTWMTYAEALDSASWLLNVEHDQIAAILEAAMEESTAEHALLVQEGEQVYPGALWYAERAIAAEIAQRLDRAPLLDPARVEALQAPDVLSPEQWSAVQMALSTPVSLLTGGPGVGKTTTLRELVNAAQTLNVPATLLAPTGKAAQRMQQATGRKASTIHRALHLAPGQLRVDADQELLYGIVIVDECFAPGTLVDTLSGARRIESLRAGDRVLNATGIDTITDVSRKVVHHVVCVHAGGRSILCSANHPFFTQRGWVAAEALTPSDWLVERTTAMRLVRERDYSKETNTSVLQSLLLCEMAHEPSGDSQKASSHGSERKKGADVQEVDPWRLPTGKAFYGTYAPIQPFNTAGGGGKEITGGQRKGDEATISDGMWRSPVSAPTKATGGTGSRMETGVTGKHGESTRVSVLLQDRSGEQGHHGRDRSGWKVSYSEEQTSGPEEGCQAGYTRVDRVEILQSGDPRLAGLRDADGCLYFYDLGVARHPSYSVNGLLVHNCSMLDTIVAAALLSGIAPSAHVLLIGDPDQLPSVGPGAVLRDLLAADICPRVHLSRVYRNDAGIAINAGHIRAGEPIVSLPDCQIRQAQRPADAAQMLIGLLTSELPARGYTPDDVLVLTPTNDGESGRHTLNTRLQAIFNGERAGQGIVQKVGEHEYELRMHDRVIVTKNSTELGVFNGETGEIIGIQQPKTIIASIDGREVRFTGAEQKMLQLAYAITGHKAQGSEAPVVIAPIFGSKVLSREWLYTSLTRARAQVYLLGDPAAIQGSIRIVRVHERRTGLVATLGEMVSRNAPQHRPRWPYAYVDGSSVYHTRRQAAWWHTSCGLDTREPSWGTVPDQDAVRACMRCEATSGAVLAAFRAPVEAVEVAG